MAWPVANKLAPAPSPANVPWSDSPQAKAPAMRSLGVLADELLPVALSWALASLLAMDM